MALMEKIKVNVYEGKYDMVMNLAQSMLNGSDKIKFLLVYKAFSF
jgi:hypothetical protein